MLLLETKKSFANQIAVNQKQAQSTDRLERRDAFYKLSKLKCDLEALTKKDRIAPLTALPEEKQQKRFLSLLGDLDKQHCAGSVAYHSSTGAESSAGVPPADLREMSPAIARRIYKELQRAIVLCCFPGIFVGRLAQPPTGNKALSAAPDPGALHSRNAFGAPHLNRASMTEKSSSSRGDPRSW